MKTFLEPDEATWGDIVKRPAIDYGQLKNIVTSIINDVRSEGDEAIKKYNKQFDKADTAYLKVTEEELRSAEGFVEPTLKEAISVAIFNIKKFHETQKEVSVVSETTVGIRCWRNSIAIEKVGLYIPGGSAALFSTLIMLAVPAQIAGCKKIVVCSPPRKDGSIDPVILYVASILGLTEVFKVGGVQAIAAMAFGTQTIPKVYKIFGPGNQYVTAAKQEVNSLGVAIDMPAGPSEVAIYADASSKAVFVASDLLSQAEHGADSQVLLVSTNEEFLQEVEKELISQTEKLARKEVVKKCLENSRFVFLKTVDAAFSLLNDYAPEHLIIASDDLDLASKVINAGSVFMGHYSPESMGDYASGTNHTLPTNGYARAYSGVSLDSFIKKITFQHATEEGIRNIGKTVEVMAAAEGLDAHKNAVTIRLESLKNLKNEI